MAKGKGSIKGWITKNGVHIPIYGEYTVRGGVEPKAKGAKFKGGKKKKVDTSTTMGKTTKQLEDKLKEKGLVLESADKADMAHKDFNDEKVTLYDNDGNVYRGTYNRYQNGDKEIVNIERDRSAEKVQAGQVEGKNPDRDEVRKSNHENMLAVKERIREKEAMEERKEKYANRDWNKDVDDAKRYGYSEQTETGKKPVTKAEESSKATPDMRDETKTLGDGGKVTPRIKAQEQAYVDDAFKPQVSEKEQKMATLRAAEKDYVNEAFNEQASSTSDYIKSSNMDGQELKIPRKTYEDRLATLKKTKEEMLKKPGQNPNTLNKYDQMIKQTEESLRTGVDAEYPPKSTKESLASDLHSRIQAQAEQADVHRQRTSVKKAPSPRTPKLVAPTEEMKKELGIDKDYGTHNLSAAKEAMKRYKTESPLYAEDKVRRYAKAAQAEKAKAQSIADAISGATGIANSGSIQNMSPSGLKSAYAEATGARKTKLANELRKRGYQLTGGRWTKKKS